LREKSIASSSKPGFMGKRGEQAKGAFPSGRGIMRKKRGKKRERWTGVPISKRSFYAQWVRGVPLCRVLGRLGESWIT